MSQVATRSPTSLTVNLGLLARHVARARCRVAFVAQSPARRLDETPEQPVLTSGRGLTVRCYRGSPERLIDAACPRSPTA
jgi:hypothetical protein